MAAGDYLNQYIEGWTKGDIQIFTGSLADNYYLDDPNSGKITKQAGGEYLKGLWQMVEGIRGKTNEPLLEFTEVVTREEQGVLTVWNWWAVPGTPMQGSALFNPPMVSGKNGLSAAHPSSSRS